VARREGNIRDYRDLRAWQQARALVKSVYAVARRFPKEELFGLAQQMRKAAVSVPSNVAEGYGRGSRKDYVRFLQIARGSLYEVQTQLLLAQDLGYLTVEQAEPVEHEVIQCRQLFHGLLRSLGEK
jgi:four helix bundle protein